MPDRPPGRVLLGVMALAVLALPASAAPGAGAIEAADAALERGDGIAAEVELQKALDGGTPRSSVAAMMGEAEFLQGNFDKAREWLAPGDFAPETRARGFQMLARLETSQGNLDDALAAYAKALEGDPGTAELWIDIARANYMAGNHLKAIEAAKTALDRDPKNPRALEFQGLLVRDSQGLEAALPWFARGLQAAPDDSSLLGEYAATLGELGRGKDMLKVTRRMIELDGKDARAFFLQAVLAARVGNEGLARRLMWKTNRAFEGMPAALLLDAVLELRAGNPALAVEALAQLAREQPDNERVQALFARALLENGEGAEVIARYAQAAARPDSSAYLQTVVGRAYEARGERANAAPFLDRAASIGPVPVMPMELGEQGELTLFRFGSDPHRLDAGIPRIRKQLAAGDVAGAAQAIETLRERYSGSVDFLTLAGDVALAQGDARTALANYRVVANVRRSHGLNLKMVRALQLLGENREARALALDYLGQHPLDRDAAWLASTLAISARDWRQAKALLTHIRGLEPEARDPQLLAMLGLAQLHLGEDQAALASANQAYRMQPLNGRSAQVLALALQRTGGNAQTIASLSAKARQAGLGSDPLLAGL